MEASRIEARDVVRVVAIALAVAALAVLLAIVVLHIRTTIRWVAAAVFLALALDPAVRLVLRGRVRGRSLPRWGAILVVYLALFAGLIFLVLHVIPPIVREIEALAHKVPTYVSDFEGWAENNDQFKELNEKYEITKTLSEQASSLPSKLGKGAGEVENITVGLLKNLLGAITILALTYFLLLDGRGMFERGTRRLSASQGTRMRRIGIRIAAIVRAYVSVNVLLAIAVGIFTWGFLEVIGFHLAEPLAVLVAFLDLIPLIGLTIGGFLVAVVLAIDNFPGYSILWLVIFLVYQQLQDRVIQPLLYRGGALRLNPAVAIVAVVVGAQLAGILGALLAIPTAASLGVLIDELMVRRPGDPEPQATE